MFMFNRFFDWFGVMFMIMFVLVIGTFVVVIVRGVFTWNKNNHSPRLTVNATIVTKREDVSYHHHHHEHAAYHMSSSTTYYVTFQVDSGDRIEFAVTGQEYGMMAEGDQGRLNFQGTRFLSFERNG